MKWFMKLIRDVRKQLKREQFYTKGEFSQKLNRVSHGIDWLTDDKKKKKTPVCNVGTLWKNSCT